MTMRMPWSVLALLVHTVIAASALLSDREIRPLVPRCHNRENDHSIWKLSMETNHNDDNNNNNNNNNDNINGNTFNGNGNTFNGNTINVKNQVYIAGLMDHLTDACDKWILTGSTTARDRAWNILQQIQQSSQDTEVIRQAQRLIQRTGMTPPPSNKNIIKEQTRTEQATERTEWEKFRTKNTKEGLSDIVDERARSAFSARLEKQNPNVFPDEPVTKTLQAFQQTATYKEELQQELQGKINKKENFTTNDSSYDMDAATKSSQLVAQAGSGQAFLGETLGVGGLDQVLAEVKRRIWVPLAAPPQLLKELGIHPVRGLLLYGKPGCGKTLIARTIGKILSPARPPTVVAGPEIMDKFVGSSEKNLRAIFDNPPDIYDSYRIDQPDGGKALQKAALHVIILDEFDAMARTRGGRDGSGNQGDAGVARDSVVNQLLAKMDGVDALPVPTLVIGMTNKRSLIEPALLRPGRFEVQIEVPPPKTTEQRLSILKVHTKHMLAAGRLLVRDAPGGSPASRQSTYSTPTYKELLTTLANDCEGMSGASLAGVARAAASHALERAVQDFVDDIGTNHQTSIMDCLVTQLDFELAVKDVVGSSGENDFADEQENVTISDAIQSDTESKNDEQEAF